METTLAFVYVCSEKRGFDVMVGSYDEVKR